jgi:hypothetical protein
MEGMTNVGDRLAERPLRAMTHSITLIGHLHEWPFCSLDFFRHPAASPLLRECALSPKCHMPEIRHALTRSDCLDEEDFYSHGSLPIGHKGAFRIVLVWDTCTNGNPQK